MSNIQEEIWKDVKDFEGYYLISNHGNLVSIKTGKEHRVSLKPHKHKGYIETHLTSPYNSATGTVHKLVAKHFLLAPLNPKATSVNHKNGIKTDNRVDNLEWVTHSQNIQHAYDTGLMRATFGARKLKIDEVISIKKLLHHGFSCKKVADLYGMSDVQINTVKRRVWSALKKVYRLSIILVLLTSCMSPMSKLRKAKRLIREAENAGVAWHVDTVFQEVKVTIDRVHIDTLVKTLNFRDTIVLTRDRLVTKVKVNTETKEVYIQSKCDSVVVVKKVPIQVFRDIEVGFSKFGLIWRVLLALIVGFMCGYFVAKLLR